MDGEPFDDEPTPTDFSAASHAAELACAQATIKEATRRTAAAEQALEQANQEIERLKNENSRLKLALAEWMPKPAIER